MRSKAEALIEVAYCYREGKGVGKDLPLAIKLYQTAIKLDPDYSRAYYGLGGCYYDPDNVEKDTQIWLPMFTKAAQLGYGNAQYDLGWYYSQINKSEEALFWYGKAVEQGDNDALYNMFAMLFWEDESGCINYKKGFELLHKAYDQKVDWAANELGFAYSGCPDESLRDQQKALKYFKEAAIKGSGAAAYYVGRAYVDGKGVPIDMHEAVVWLKYSADHGYEDALNNVAAYYCHPEKFGLEISKDDIVPLLEKASNSSSAYCYELMRIHDEGRYGPIDRKKADFYCKKEAEIKVKKKEQLNSDAQQYLLLARNNRSYSYMTAFAKWSITPDTDIAGKLAVIEQFEKNVTEESDLNSLKTLAMIYAGMRHIPRLKCPVIDEQTGETKNVVIAEAPAEFIDSLPVDGILNYKRAFELLDKGIEWGDTSCDELKRQICRHVIENNR